MQLSLLRRGGDEESYTDCSAICRAAQVLSQLACPARCEIIHRIISLYARALSSSTLFIFLSQKLKTDSSEPVLISVVEMRRVELLSESISARISPSAAADLNFAKQDAPRQASSSAIPSFPCASGSRHRVFLYNWRRDSDLQVNQSRRRGRFMRQAAMLQMRNYCYF